jgi:hypothetical protein
MKPIAVFFGLRLDGFAQISIFWISSSVVEDALKGVDKNYFFFSFLESSISSCHNSL